MVDDNSEEERTSSIAKTRMMGRVIEELYYQAKVVDNRYKIF